MRALVLHGAGDLRLEERPDPVPGVGEMLLQVETVGVCGTDAGEFTYGPKLFPISVRHPVTGHLGPMIPGHEFSGRVVTLGDAVDGFTVGDLVACAGSSPCGSCRFCRRGLASRCERYWSVGLNRDGALAEYCAVPASSCVEVGTLGLTPEIAALAQPMSIAVHALRRAGLSGDDTVVVVGVGGVGAFAVYAAVAAGASVVALDLRPERREVAANLGAIVTADIPPEYVLGSTDVVLEISGTEAGMRTALDCLGPGGRLVAVGFQKGPLLLDLIDLTLAEQQLIGTNGVDPATDLPEAVSLLAAAPPDIWHDIAPTVIPLEDVAATLAGIASGDTGPIKTLVSPRP